MKKNDPVGTTLEDSLRILSSIFVTLDQNLEAIIYYEDHLSNESQTFINSPLLPAKEEYTDEAIIESLWFQIVLKACSFLEEWDEVLGVKTENCFKSKIEEIKSIVAPARRQINKWRDLRKFRNEIIAHNLRSKNSNFSIQNIHIYRVPGCVEDFIFLTNLLQRMIGILTHFFPEEFNNMATSIPKLLLNKDIEEIKKIIHSDDIIKVDNTIRDNLDKSYLSEI